MNPIQQYRTANGLTQEDLAAMIAVSQGAIAHIETGRRRPSALLSVRIEEATAGAVTRYELRPDVFGDPPIPGKGEAAA